MIDPLAARRIKLIQYVVTAVGDHVQIDLMAIVDIGRVGRLISKIKVFR